jgi:hypothetical protein
VQGPPGLVRRRVSESGATMVSFMGFESLVDSDEPLTFDDSRIRVSEYVAPEPVVTVEERLDALQALLIEKNVFNRSEVTSRENAIKAAK